MASTIGRYLRADDIDLNLASPNKLAAVTHLVTMLARSAQLDEEDAAMLEAAVLQRESEGNTAFGRGVATPHIRTSVVQRYTIVAARLVEPLDDFESIDNQPVSLLFLLVGPPQAHAIHLDVVARLMNICRNAAARQRLLEAETPESFLAAIVDSEERAEKRR